MRNKKIPAGILRTIFLLSVVLVATYGERVLALPTHYFPGSNINYTGGANSWPLNATPTSGSNKCQWLYKNTDFNTTLSNPLLITTIYIKPATTKSSFTFSNLSIKLGNTTLTTLSTGTWLSGLTTVYNPASLTLSTTSGSWLAFTLPTPFYYTGGNLLLEITHSTTTSSGITINQYSVSGRNGRKYGSSSNASSSGADAATAVFGFDAVPAACSGTPLAPTITTSSMSNAAPICAGSTKSLTATDPNGPITGINHMWQSAPAATGPFTNVTTGTGATTLNYTTGPVASTTWFRLGAICTNSSMATYSAPYQVLVGAAQPGGIMGRATSCPGDTATFTAANTSGHTYTWSLPAGWTGSSTTNSILVTMSSPGTISVTATGCGGTSIARTRSIVSGSAPATPGSIAGPAQICQGTTHTYSVAPVPGAMYYTWTLPGGWSGTSTTNSITVSTGAAGGSVKVKAGNGCGSSANATRIVTIINSLPNPGTITNSATGGAFCSGALYSFSISPVPGATAYVWSLPSGWTGTNTGTSIQAFAGSSGQIQVTAYVSCATSPSSSLNTTVSSTVTPTVSIAPAAAILCQGKPNTFMATSTNAGTSPSYQWKKNGVNVSGSGASYTSTSIANGDMISVVMISSALCRSVDSVPSTAYKADITPSVTPGIGINSTPVVTICAGTTLAFSTHRTGGGPTPTYQWYRNGTAIISATDSTYKTSALSNGDTITVQMISSAVCATAPSAASNKVGIIVNAVVNPTISISASSTAAGEPITFTSVQSGGGPTPAYQWILNNVEIPGETNDTYTSSSLKAGDRVALRMQSYDPCAQPVVVTSEEKIITEAAGVAGTGNWEGGVSLYPNPNSGHFSISASSCTAHSGQRISIDVYSVFGQRVYHGELMPGQTKWSYDVQLSNDVANGNYILRLSIQAGMNANLPLVINR